MNKKCRLDNPCEKIKTTRCCQNCELAEEGSCKEICQEALMYFLTGESEMREKYAEN